jgi:hypothetical protein
MTTERQTVRTVGPTRICRALNSALRNCENPVSEAPAQSSPASPQASPESARESYTGTISPEIQSDSLSNVASYAVEVLNRKGRGAGLSNEVKVSLLRTLPPPKDFEAHVTAQGVVLSWNIEAPSLPSGGIRYAVRIERKQAGNPPTVIAEVPLEGDQKFIDSNIEWEKSYEYHANVVTIADENDSHVQVEGDDTAELKVFADDVFPPAVPGGLQAVFSGPGQAPFIDLIWAPDTDADFAGYNVYRSEAGQEAKRLNTELVKNPAYRDSDVERGKTYIYSISAVDLRGNESARSEKATESVPQ